MLTLNAVNAKDARGVLASLEARAACVAPPPWCDPTTEEMKVCRDTVKMVKLATSGWSPLAHHLHHPAVRKAVHTLLLVSERLCTMGCAAAREEDDALGQLLPSIPPELWLVFSSFLLRHDWPVENRTIVGSKHGGMGDAVEVDTGSVHADDDAGGASNTDEDPDDAGDGTEDGNGDNVDDTAHIAAAVEEVEDVNADYVEENNFTSVHYTTTARALAAEKGMDIVDAILALIEGSGLEQTGVPALLKQMRTEIRLNDVDQVCAGDGTALMNAVYAKKTSWVRALISNGADPYRETHTEGSWEVCLSHGKGPHCECNPRDGADYGCRFSSPIEAAADSDQFAVVELMLLKFDGKKSDALINVFHTACDRGNTAIAKVILEEAATCTFSVHFEWVPYDATSDYYPETDFYGINWSDVTPYRFRDMAVYGLLAYQPLPPEENERWIETLLEGGADPNIVLWTDTHQHVFVSIPLLKAILAAGVSRKYGGEHLHCGIDERFEESDRFKEYGSDYNTVTHTNATPAETRVLLVGPVKNADLSKCHISMAKKDTEADGAIVRTNSLLELKFQGRGYDTVATRYGENNVFGPKDAREFYKKVKARFIDKPKDKETGLQGHVHFLKLLSPKSRIRWDACPCKSITDTTNKEMEKLFKDEPDLIVEFRRFQDDADRANQQWRDEAEQAQQRNKKTLAWATLTIGWSALRVAVTCRKLAVAKKALQLGRIDPDGDGAEEMMRVRLAAAANLPPWNDPTHAETTTCFASIQLAADATSGWSIATHWLHHSGVQRVVSTMMLLEQHFHRRSEGGNDAAAASASQRAGGEPQLQVGRRITRSMGFGTLDVLPLLPKKLWLCINSFILRSHCTPLMRAGKQP